MRRGPARWGRGGPPVLEAALFTGAPIPEFLGLFSLRGGAGRSRAAPRSGTASTGLGIRSWVGGRRGEKWGPPSRGEDFCPVAIGGTPVILEGKLGSRSWCEHCGVWPGGESSRSRGEILCSPPSGRGICRVILCHSLMPRGSS